MDSLCQQCQKQVAALQEQCEHCGFRIVLEPEEQIKARYLRGPSLGALFFTQGWTFGARLYLWFVLSLIPVVGFVVLFACFFFGRRWSWKYGGWSDWAEFQKRLRLLDLIATGWLAGLLIVYFLVRK